MITAARRSSAASVTAVVPYFGYKRDTGRNYTAIASERAWARSLLQESAAPGADDEPEAIFGKRKWATRRARGGAGPRSGSAEVEGQGVDPGGAVLPHAPWEVVLQMRKAGETKDQEQGQKHGQEDGHGHDTDSNGYPVPVPPISASA